MKGPSVYWAISSPVPPEKREKDKAQDSVVHKLHNIASVFSFPVPDLRVGTLDALMSLSDDLIKLDLSVESSTRKIANQLFALYDPKDHANLLTVEGAAPDIYLTHFKWNEAKYPIKSSCRELTELINSQVSKLEEELRVKSSEYSATVHSLTQNERQQTGNLASKDLSEIVKPDQWRETEYLTTLFVAVPKHSKKIWENSYETLTEFVLPRSSTLITEDNEYCLYSVSLFKRDIDNFKNAVREKKFTAREFQFDSSKIEKSKKEKEDLITTKEIQKSKLVQWCKTNFAEGFIGWIHLKAIRVFVESILRYGLPASFQSILVQPAKGADKKVRAALNDLFKHLGSKHLEGESEDGGVSETFYPYVSLTINLEMKTV